MRSFYLTTILLGLYIASLLMLLPQVGAQDRFIPSSVSHRIPASLSDLFRKLGGEIRERREACIALGSSSQLNAIQRILDLYGSNHWKKNVRAGLAECLGSFHDFEESAHLLGILKELLSDTALKVRTAAIDSLEFYGADACSSIRAVASINGDEKTKERAIGALRSIRERVIAEGGDPKTVAICNPPTVGESSQDVILTPDDRDRIQSEEIPLSFEVVSIAGKKIRSVDLEEKVVVITAWSIGCKPCLSEIPELNAIAHEFSNENVLFLAPSFEGVDEMKRFLASHRFDFKIIPRGESLIPMHSGLPTHFIWNRGVIVETYFGAGQEAITWMRQAIRRELIRF